VRRALLFYYVLGTPVFWALDLLLGLNVRAVFLPNPALRSAYYAVAFGCGLLIHARPARARLVAIAESGLNLGLLIVAVWLAVFATAENLAAGAPPSPVLTMRGMTNVALSGLVFAAGFYGHLAERVLARRP